MQIKKNNPIPDPCPLCSNRKNQFNRVLHFLRDFSSPQSLAFHLASQIGPSADPSGAIAAAQSWVDSITASYANTNDPHTGRPLQPWEAWKLTQEMAARHQP